MDVKYQNNKIRIRPFVADDALRMYNLVIKSQAEFRKYLPWANTEFTEAHSQQWVEWAYYNWMSQRQYDFVIADVNTDEFLGGIGLLEVDLINQHAKLGYWIGTAYTGQGLTTKAARLIMKFARQELKLKKLIIRICEDNIASIHVAKKLGAHFIGKEEQQEFHNDKWQDTWVYELKL